MQTPSFTIGNKSMANKNIRSMKVYEKNDYKYRTIPMIKFSGKWLESAGFEIGDYITVSCEDGKIVIAPDTDRKYLTEEERTFMNRETKKLHERFLQKHRMCVAEFFAEYGKVAYVWCKRTGLSGSELLYGAVHGCVRCDNP